MKQGAETAAGEAARGGGDDGGPHEQPRFRGEDEAAEPADPGAEAGGGAEPPAGAAGRHQEEDHGGVGHRNFVMLICMDNLYSIEGHT